MKGDKMKYTIKQSGLHIKKEQEQYTLYKHHTPLITGIENIQLAKEIMQNQYQKEKQLRVIK